MNSFLHNLRELFTTITDQSWGSTAGYVTLAITVVILAFSAGTVARVIFGKDTGLPKTAIATLLVIAAGLAGAAASLTWVGSNPTYAAVAGVVAALAGVLPAGRVLGLPYGQAFGIMLFSVAITAAGAFGSGKAAKALSAGAEEIKDGAVELKDDAVELKDASTSK